MTYGGNAAGGSGFGMSGSGASSSALTMGHVYLEGEHCDPNTPNKEHPQKCSSFLQCERGIDGVYKFVAKNCGPGTMYNPEIMVCDFPDNVIAIRPMCGSSGGMISGSGASANA